MCTIGNSFYNLNGRKINSVFKQCDLTEPTVFLTPYIRTSEKDIRYLALTRIKGEECPAWAGVNEYGVSFVAADSYIDSDNVVSSTGVLVFDMYLEIITDYKDAKSAVEMAKKFYQNTMKEADILMIADGTESYFIEAYKGSVQCIKRTDKYFASTNHFRTIYGAAPYSQNHSTYLRLNRAESILNYRSNLDGIGDVLRDDYYGETVWSICRYANNSVSALSPEELFYTQASVIFTIIPNEYSEGKPHVVCEYVINGNASQPNGGYKWRPFENSKPENILYIGMMENLK